MFNRPFIHTFPCSPDDNSLAELVFNYSTSSYDCLYRVYPLERLGIFLKRLELDTTIPPTPIMTNVIVRILVVLYLRLALAVKYCVRWTVVPAR
jgi:hypothetical protein